MWGLNNEYAFNLCNRLTDCDWFLRQTRKIFLALPNQSFYPLPLPPPLPPPPPYHSPALNYPSRLWPSSVMLCFFLPRLHPPEAHFLSPTRIVSQREWEWFFTPLRWRESRVLAPFSAVFTHCSPPLLLYVRWYLWSVSGRVAAWVNWDEILFEGRAARDREWGKKRNKYMKFGRVPRKILVHYHLCHDGYIFSILLELLTFTEQTCHNTTQYNLFLYLHLVWVATKEKKIASPRFTSAHNSVAVTHGRRRFGVEAE